MHPIRVAHPVCHRRPPACHRSVLLGALVIACTTADGGVVYVDHDSVGPIHDGSGWCNAFLALDPALGVAVSGDVIRIADGTYKPDTTGLVDPHTAVFLLVDGVRIEGGYAGCGAADPDARDVVAYKTVLSGDLSGNDAAGPAAPGTSACCNVGGGPGCGNTACEARVCAVRPTCCSGSWDASCRDEAQAVCCDLCGENISLCDNTFHVLSADSTGVGTTVDGVTIRGGNAVGGFERDRNGGGIYNRNGALTVVDAVIEKNTATHSGGGMYNGAGSLPVIRSSVFQDNLARSGPGIPTNVGGGGVYINNSTAVIEGSSFLRNQAPFWFSGCASGGGILTAGGGVLDVADSLFEDNYGCHNGGGGGIGGTAHFTSCIFRRNISDGFSGDGGGISFETGGSIDVTDCHFEDNRAGGSAGAILFPHRVERCTFLRNTSWFAGGAVVSASVVSDSTFIENDSHQGGGAINGVTYLANSIFRRNTTDLFAGAVWGGGTLVNCVFDRNHSDADCGALSGKVTSAVNAMQKVIGCTFSGNTANGVGGGIYLGCTGGGSLNMSLTNTILWGNTDTGGANSGETAQITTTGCSSVSLNYSNVQGLTGSLGGSGNIGSNPQFVDAVGGDLRLVVGSPCLDAGSNAALPPDTADLDADGDVFEPVPFDAQGGVRRFDMPLAPDVGAGSAPLVDIGAYEWADCNQNAVEDSIDIALQTSPDCNANGRPDECDLADDTSVDLDLNSIPDECLAPEAIGPGDDVCVGGGSAGLPCTQHSDCPGGLCRLKNRFVSPTLPNYASVHGVKVTIVGLDFNSVAMPSLYNGTDRWAAAPSLNVSDGVSPSFNASALQCAVLLHDWSAVGRIH